MKYKKVQMGIGLLGLICFYVIISGTAFADSLKRDSYSYNSLYDKPKILPADCYSDDSCNIFPNDCRYSRDSRRNSTSKWEKWGILR